MKNLFFELTGKQFYPYQYQLDVAWNILQNKKVILQAPTGSGKTLASILPFIYAKKNNLDFPRRLIYVVPRRVLANSLYTAIKDNEYIKENNIEVTIQTGEYKGDKYFLEGDIIFTTIDQLLSSLLCIPFSLSKRQWNINASILFESYIVIDEMHLLEPDKDFLTTFYLLKQYTDFINVCIMTATLSQSLIKEISKELQLTMIPMTKEYITDIKSEKDKERIIKCCNIKLNADRVLKTHKDKTIVILNKVNDVQELYLELKNKIESLHNKPQLICIHSRMLQKDRSRKEKIIREKFEARNSNIILISTQVIEVGVDISSTVMHTSISDINSFLQRIGRLARRKGERGIVYVYDIENCSDNYSYLPYDKEICKKTWNELNKYDGKKLDYFTSQKIIDTVLTKRDLENLTNIKANGPKEDMIYKCLKEPERKYASKLIRDVNNKNVIVASDPDKELKGINPFEIDTIPINLFTLKNALKKIDDNINEDWLVKIIREKEQSFIFDEDEDDFQYFDENLDKIETESVIILNKKYVSYSSEIGLNFRGIGNGNIIVKNVEEDNIEYNMFKETYEEHIESMIKCYDKRLKGVYKSVFSKIENYLELKISMDEIIKYMFIWHDAGKLDIKWQKAAHEIQKSIGDSVPDNVMLAHTGKSERIGKNHASFGAYIGPMVLQKLYVDNKIDKSIAIPLLSAIIRHHSVNATKLDDYTIEQYGNNVLKSLMKKYTPNIYKAVENDIDRCIMMSKFGEKKEQIVNLNDRWQAILYFIFVRILRVSDSHSFKINREEV
ncbi:MAG: CRISPR-associated endonuclease/helicase Cas3 [Candidatus Petromonas sp.]|jgi:CRISPR-associated endonuclease/helicase Cas3|nr:CRISPR-associated endonuclease/helicase Cas3 [Candidatus Petromonas sp.]